MLFILPEVLTPVLDLPLFYFRGLFPSLSFQFSSVAQLCSTLCDPMDCSTPGLPVHHQLPSFLRLMFIESVMPSSHLILCQPLLLLPSIFTSIRVFSNEKRGGLFLPFKDLTVFHCVDRPHFVYTFIWSMNTWTVSTFWLF